MLCRGPFAFVLPGAPSLKRRNTMSIAQTVDRGVFTPALPLPSHLVAPMGRVTPGRQPSHEVPSVGRFQRDGTLTTKKACRCSRKDVVDAFWIVEEEIRLRCQRLALRSLTQAEACRLALRVRDQRELVRQLTERDDARHVRCLLGLNRKLWRHVVMMAQQAGLDTVVLVFK